MEKQYKKPPFSVLIVLCVVVLYPSYSLAEGLMEDYAFRIGIASKALDLEVSDVNETNYSGSMSEGEYTTVAFALNSPYDFFKDSKFGYYIEYGFSSFEMDVQVTNGGAFEEDLGTSVDGLFFYLAPVLFYNFGDNVNKKQKNSFIIGIGAGLGYLNASGDIIFTETTSELFDVDVDKFDLSAVILLEYQHNNWYVRYQDSGPEIRHNGFDYIIYDNSLTIGYTIRL